MDPATRQKRECHLRFHQIWQPGVSPEPDSPRFLVCYNPLSDNRTAFPDNHIGIRDNRCLNMPSRKTHPGIASSIRHKCNPIRLPDNPVPDNGNFRARFAAYFGPVECSHVKEPLSKYMKLRDIPDHSTETSSHLSAPTANSTWRIDFDGKLIPTPSPSDAYGSP